MILGAVASCCMKEDNLLGAAAAGFVENFGLASDGRVNEDVFACEVVLVGLGLLVFGGRSVESIANHL
jgi:hypothetical protein